MALWRQTRSLVRLSAGWGRCCITALSKWFTSYSYASLTVDSVLNRKGYLAQISHRLLLV